MLFLFGDNIFTIYFKPNAKPQFFTAQCGQSCKGGLCESKLFVAPPTEWPLLSTHRSDPPTSLKMSDFTFNQHRLESPFSVLLIGVRILSCVIESSHVWCVSPLLCGVSPVPRDVLVLLHNGKWGLFSLIWILFFLKWVLSFEVSESFSCVSALLCGVWVLSCVSESSPMWIWVLVCVVWEWYEPSNVTKTVRKRPVAFHQPLISLDVKILNWICALGSCSLFYVC